MCSSASCAGRAATDTAGSPAQAGASGSAGAVSVDAGAPPSTAPIPMGACVPDGPNADALGAARTLLVTGPRQLAAVAATPTGVFVSDLDAGIFRLPLGSTTLERVVATSGTQEFLAADLHLYWLQTDSIYKASITATDAMPMLVGGGLQHPVTSLTFDASNLYFVDIQAQSLLRLALTGGPAESIVGGVAAQDLVLHAGYLYYPDANSKQVYRVSTKAGSKPEALSSGTHVAPLAIDADTTKIYWADDSQLLATEIGKPAVSKAIGVAGPNGSGRGRIHKLRVAAARVYWADDAGNLGWTATDGASCALLVKAAGEVRGWDIDDTSVYLAVSTPVTQSSELWKLVR